MLATNAPYTSTIVNAPSNQEESSAWVIIGPATHSASILAANFSGGILKTEIEVAPDTLVPLTVDDGNSRFTVHIHVLPVEWGQGWQGFRLYGTEGPARTRWDEYVRKLRAQE